MKKLVLIISVLFLCLNLFAEDKKEGPNVLCMVLYSKNAPSLINISYDTEKTNDFLTAKIGKFRELYKGDLQVMPNEGEKSTGITALVKNSNYKVGAGETLEPFMKTFSEETEIVVLFTGEFEPIKDPLIIYDKEDVSILAHSTKDTFQYNIKSNGKTISLPSSQKVVTRYKILTKIGLYFMYLVIGVFILLIFISLLRRSVKMEKRRNK